MKLVKPKSAPRTTGKTLKKTKIVYLCHFPRNEEEVGIEATAALVQSSGRAEEEEEKEDKEKERPREGQKQSCSNASTRREGPRWFWRRKK